MLRAVDHSTVYTNHTLGPFAGWTPDCFRFGAAMHFGVAGPVHVRFPWERRSRFPRSFYHVCPPTGAGAVLTTQDADLPDMSRQGGGRWDLSLLVICIPLNIHEAEHLFIYVWATEALFLSLFFSFI